MTPAFVIFLGQANRVFKLKNSTGKGRGQQKTKAKQRFKLPLAAQQKPIRKRGKKQTVSPITGTAQEKSATKAKSRGNVREAQNAEKQLEAVIQKEKRISKTPSEWWRNLEKPSSESADRRLPMSEKRKAALARSARKKAAKENVGSGGDAYDFPSNLEEEFDNLTTTPPVLAISK